MNRLLGLVALSALMVACGASSTPSAAPATEEPEAEAGIDDGGVIDAAPDAVVPTGKCADAFGSALTEGFGRIDGIVYAVQKPSDTQCVMPNDDHVVVQVLMNGAVYRMVVNVQSDRQGVDPKIRVAVVPHALPPPAFAEGWHLGAVLDYARTLDVHAGSAFTPRALAEAVAQIDGEVKVGDPVSVYAVSGAGRPESAHLVHRNRRDEDGAIVVLPSSATPKFLLFHFDGQTF
ncbi:MAG: hypothetical protein KF819_23035 [Labilithrix sp.]|nr:hypothetical protein [Labilithrix sp.]